MAGKIDQMATKYTNIFHCKTLKMLSKLGFLVSKETIWQPCPGSFFAALPFRLLYPTLPRKQEKQTRRQTIFPPIPDSLRGLEPTF
jgi:hypothetical protein